MKILIIAGGTGGHIFPALAVAESLQKNGAHIEWMGTERRMEKKLVGDRYPIHFLKVETARGKNFFNKLFSPFRIVFAIFHAFLIIRRLNPDVVMSMGGYASGPGGIAAWILRKKLIIHEQNAKAGLTNRILSHFANTTLQAFPNAFSKNTEAITVGNPVRESICALSKIEKNFSTSPLKILILGGSQGAHAINELILSVLVEYEGSARANKRANQNILIWHQTGLNDFENIQKKYASHENLIYRVAPFIEKIEEAYAWADIVICRAGALTVSEVAAAGLPSILIPYPFAADDHQYANALVLKNSGAGIVFRESEITKEKLAEKINIFIASPEVLKQMSLQAKSCAKLDVVINIVKNINQLRSCP